jgi:hypothetical protein
MPLSQRMSEQVQKEERWGDNSGRCHHCGLKRYDIFHAILLGALGRLLQQNLAIVSSGPNAGPKAKEKWKTRTPVRS